MSRPGMEKNPLIYANWPLVIIMFLLLVAGMINLYSANISWEADGVKINDYFQKQFLWVFIGFVCMIITMLFDYRRLASLAEPILLLSICLLVMVLFMGSSAGIARRWLTIGSFSFQPSEAAKIGIMLLAAKLLARGNEPLGWTGVLVILLTAIVPVALVLKQPDLGTALIILFILGGMLLYRGVKRSIIIAGLIVLVLSPIVLVKAVLPNLEDYQRRRITTFIKPDEASPDEKYQKDQSAIAIGSGQTWGIGYLDGRQNKLKFIPERHTDFAVAVFAEEWGFAGALLLVSLFSLFLLSIQATARDAKDGFGSMLAAGIFFYFFWQILINIGMVLGIMPVVGIPLPFISYGGSATIVNFCLVGLVLNISMRRFVFKSY